MSEVDILHVNIVLYALFTIYFYKRYGLTNLSTIASVVYLIFSIIARLYFGTPVFFYSFSNAKMVKMDGMIWLAAFNFLMCNLLRGFGYEKGYQITGYDERFFRKLLVFLIVCGGISLAVQLPSAIGNLMSGNLSDIRDLTYTDGAQVDSNIVVSVYSRIFGGLNEFLLLIPAFRYFVLKKFDLVDKMALVVYVLTFICTMGAYVSRAIIVFRLMDCVVLYFLLRRYIELKRLKYVVLLLIPAGFLLSAFFSSVTSSRFGSTSADNKAEMMANLRYAGEPQLNFMAIMYDETRGSTYGFRSLPVYRKIIGLDYFGKYGKDKESNLAQMDKVHPYPNYIFYTAGGDAYLDWGKYVPIAFLILLNIYYYRKKEKMKGNFQVLVWEHLIAFFVFYGVFYANYQNESSNFLFIFLVMMWMKFGNKKYVGGVISAILLLHRIKQINVEHLKSCSLWCSC